MRLGFVDYINALPFTLPFRLGKMPASIIPTYAIPSKLNALLRENSLDAALTSSALYLDSSFSLLPGYGIAAHKEILSVNLYHKKGRPLSEIALTHHSETSISLLKVLLQQWRVQTSFIPLDRSRPLESYEAFLLIGDEALEKMHIPGYETIDLAKAWHEITHLPFVFAVFSIRNDLDQVQLLQESLEKALAWSKTHFETLIQYAHEKTHLPELLIRKYYSLCIYRLQDKEMEGLEKFKEMRKTDVQAVCT